MRILLKGSTGYDVTQLQSSLKLLGYDPGPIDGIFGPKTEAAVIQFQKGNGLVADGIVGSITWENLQSQVSNYRVYVIKPGDTFYKIAVANNISLSELLTFNPGIDPKNLLVGLVIQLAGITYPPDGAELPYSDVNITWSAVQGATGYRVVVSDMDNPILYLRDYQANMSADTLNFNLTTDHIISGHHYQITVYFDKPIDPKTGTGLSIPLGKANVIIGEITYKPLTIISPEQNATIVQGTPVILQWDTPPDASGLDVEIQITSDSGTTSYSASNASEIPQYLLTPGKHHITVSLRSGAMVIYQGSTDITIVSK